MRIAKTDKESCLLYVIISLCAALSGFAYIAGNTDTVLLGFWFVFCALLFVFRLEFFMKYIHYEFFLTLNILGVYMIDNYSFYLQELRTYSRDYDAFGPIVIIHFVFMFLLLIIDRYFAPRDLKPTNIVKIEFQNRNVIETVIVIIGIVFQAIVLYLLINALMKPSFAYGYDRFEYAQRIISGNWAKLSKLSNWMIPVIPMLLVNKKRVLALSSLLTYSLYLFLIGNKFGALFNLFILLIPYLFVTFKLNKIEWKTLLILFLVLLGVSVVFILILFVFHKLTYGYDWNQFVEYLGQRIAQQGQIWWGVYGKCKGVPMHFNEINDEIIGFWGMDDVSVHNMNYGIYKMMELVTPYENYIAKLLTGSRFTTSTCASIYYYTHFWGFIVLLPFAAVILSYFVNWYWRSLYSNEIIGVIVSWTVIGRLASIYSMSEFQMFFNLKYFTVIVIAIIIDRYLRYRNKNEIQH